MQRLTIVTVCCRQSSKWRLRVACASVLISLHFRSTGAWILKWTKPVSGWDGGTGTYLRQPNQADWAMYSRSGTATRLTFVSLVRSTKVSRAYFCSGDKKKSWHHG